MDALAVRDDEGRGSLRYASGSWQTSNNPKTSEWGNPPYVSRVLLTEFIGQQGQPGELKHLSTWRKRNQRDSVSSGERTRISLVTKSLFVLAEYSGKFNHSG